MKSLALFALFFILIGAVVGLREPRCGERPAAIGMGYIQCHGSLIYYTYYPNTDECLPFNYGGCGGNRNRFDSLADCEERCKENLITFTGI